MKSISEAFEAEIARLTRPVNGQLPRPWMTDLRDPLEAKLFIVGMNQAKGFPVERVGTHSRFLDALYNRNGQGCRALYDEVTGGLSSPTRMNIDSLRQRLAIAGVSSILETNVICYSTPMSGELARTENRGGARRGDKIFQTLLTYVRPQVLVAHGAGTINKLCRIVGANTLVPPQNATDLRQASVQLDGGVLNIFVLPSLAPPAWNRWKSWAEPHLQLLVKSVSLCLDREQSAKSQRL